MKSSGLCTRPLHSVAAVYALSILSALPVTLAGQSVDAREAGPRRNLPLAREVALARSAAPAAISADATVLAWKDGKYDVVEEGSNGVSCYVSRSWPESLEPHCFDREGSRTILRIHIWQVEQLAAGREKAEVAMEIDRRISSGEFSVPSRPAMSWMMSADQELISPEGVAVGAWKPHVMLFYPNLDAESLGLGAVQGVEGGVVVDPGTPLSNLMIPVEAFVQVQGQEGRDGV